MGSFIIMIRTFVGARSDGLGYHSGVVHQSSYRYHIVSQMLGHELARDYHLLTPEQMVQSVLLTALYNQNCNNRCE